jgi:hypothetical protein
MDPVTSPEPFFSLLRDYGWIGVLIWLAAMQVWPWFRDKVYPDLAAARTKAAFERAELQRQLVEEAHRREDRAWSALASNTTAIVSLQTTLAQMDSTLRIQSQALGELSNDVAALYAHLRANRPSDAPPHDQPK